MLVFFTSCHSLILILFTVILFSLSSVLHVNIYEYSTINVKINQKSGSVPPNL
jgi:hypothetical protein